MIGRRRLRVLDERDDFAVLRAPDADPFLDAGQLVRAGIGTRLRVRYVDRVVLRDEDATRPAELAPLVQVVAVLIEDLDPIVLAIADEQPSARVHRNRVRLAHLAAARSLPAPLLHVLPVLGESADAVVP